MRFIDFFAGIGGFRLGMEMAGHECVGHCEIDNFADKSYRAMHIPKESEWFAKDITTVEHGDLPEAECYCFGFPCQSFSVAGSRRGFADTRGTLFFEVMRIAKERKPEYLFAENVAGLLSHDGGRTFGTILAALGELGYWWEYQVLNSKNFGVPQNRERVFIIGHLGGRGGREIFPLGSEHEAINELQGQHTGTITTRTGTGVSAGIYIVEGERVSQEINQIGNLIDTDSFGGNPQRGRVYGTDGISPCLTALGGGGSEPKIVIGSTQKNAYVGDGKESPTLTQSMGTGGGHIPMVGFEREEVAIPVLTPDKAKTRQNGRRFKENGEPMFTLTAQDRHGVILGGIYTDASPKFQKGPLKGLSRCLKANAHDAGVTDGIRIRKLTPKECWRLQGFPDEYFERAKAAGVSDSQLYKQAGNSVTVNVIYEIAKRLKEKTK